MMLFLVVIMLSAKYNNDMNISSLAKVLGRRGGQVRAKRLSPERRREIAALGGKARANSLDLYKRMIENFRYVQTIREMCGETSGLKREKNFSGKLPGLYVKK